MVLRKHLVAFDVKIRTASSSTLVLKESEVGRGQKGTHGTTVAPSRNYFHKYSRDFYLTTLVCKMEVQSQVLRSLQFM